MNRLTFLKIGACTTVAAAGRIAFPWAAAAGTTKYVSYGGLLFRAGGAGRIETSADNGATWKLQSDLGSMYSITNLAVNRRTNTLGLTVGYSGYTFPLVLGPDMRSWLLTA